MRNLLWVEGSLPGPQGGWVMVRDSRRKRKAELQKLPFPTVIDDPGEATQAAPRKNYYDRYKA